MLIYTVQPGDTIFRIAMQLGSSVALIMAANNLADPHQIVPGQRLLVPILTGTVTRVQAGDSLFLIARHFDVPVEVVAAANNLSPPYEIRPGQLLQIPVLFVNTSGCMAFQSTRANGVWDTWLRSPNRANGTRLTFNLGGPATVPQWSPDGSLIGLVSPGGTLYVVDAASGQSRILLGGLSEFTKFAWSPDSQHIAVEVQNQIILIHVATAATRFLTNGEAPAFYPDGKSLIYSLEATNGQQILVINVDGTGQRLVTTISGADPVADIDVDPNGQLIALMQSGPERSTILIVDLTSGVILPTPLTAINRDFFPRWSPDGETLAYNSTLIQDEGLTGQIRLVDRQGHLVADLTDTACLGERIAWTPDGQFISYPNCLNRLPQITLVGLHRSPVQITAHGINVHPNWRSQPCPLEKAP